MRKTQLTCTTTKTMRNYCSCYKPLSIREGLVHLWDELKEFIAEPSKDEFSDICYGVNRLIGGLFKKEYLRLVPGDKMHIDKIDHRMQTHGCIRSERHMVNH